MVLIKAYSAAELAEGTAITDETLDFSQHTITIFQLDASSAPVTEAIPVNTPASN